MIRNAEGLRGKPAVAGEVYEPLQHRGSDGLVTDEIPARRPNRRLCDGEQHGCRVGDVGVVEASHERRRCVICHDATR
jgi:hypothetical protein